MTKLEIFLGDWLGGPGLHCGKVSVTGQGNGQRRVKKAVWGFSWVMESPEGSGASVVLLEARTQGSVRLVMLVSGQKWMVRRCL